MDIGLVGIPWEGSTTKHAGAGHGPRQVRDLSTTGGGPSYVNFGVDVPDPVYAPSTGTPEIGGMTTLEAQWVVRKLQGLNFVGGDVAEQSPPFDTSSNTAMVGATMLFEFLCALADTVNSCKGAQQGLKA